MRLRKPPYSVVPAQDTLAFSHVFACSNTLMDNSRCCYFTACLLSNTWFWRNKQHSLVFLVTLLESNRSDNVFFSFRLRLHLPVRHEKNQFCLLRQPRRPTTADSVLPDWARNHRGTERTGLKGAVRGPPQAEEPADLLTCDSDYTALHRSQKVETKTTKPDGIFREPNTTKKDFHLP